MQWVLAAVVCVAIANANIIEEDVNSAYDEEQNNVGVFMPRSLNQGNLGRELRSFYQSYWLYPSMALKNGFPYPEFNYVEPLTFQDVFEKPVFVVTPSKDAQSMFSLFYLQNGLRMLHRHKAFSWLQDFFKHPGLKGLIFYPHLIYNVRFFETPVNSVTLPDDMRMSDFVSIENCVSGRIPYMFVAPEELFDRMHFDNIAKVSDFKVYNDAIEVHPVMTQPRPVYEPFYGHKSPEASQHEIPPTQAPQARGPSSLNSLNFPTSDQMGQPHAVMPVQSSADLVRDVYGGEGYQLPGQYQQSQSIDGQYVNYEYDQPGLLRYQNMNAVPLKQYNQGVVVGSQIGGKAGAQVDAAYGLGREVFETGRKAIVQTNAAQNPAHLEAGGQVKYFEASKGSGIARPAIEGSYTQGVHMGVSKVEGKNNLYGQAEGGFRVSVSGGQSSAESASRVASGSMVNQEVHNIGSQHSSQSSGESIDVVTVSRKNTGSKSAGQSAIQFPKDSGIGFSGVGLQGAVASTGLGGSASRSESVTFGSQGAIQEGITGGAHGGSLSRTGDVETITETYTISRPSEQTLIQTVGHLGAQRGVSGDKSQGSRGVGGLLKTVGGGVNKIFTLIDSTTHGLGDHLRQNEGQQVVQQQQSENILSSSLLSKSVPALGATQAASSSFMESSTTDGPKKLISAVRSLSEETTSASAA